MSLGDSATPLGKVRGLGSAHEGAAAWLSERVSSVALILLGAWFLASLLLLPSLDRRTLAEWLRSPAGAVPMAILVVVGFWHALGGLKVVVDDYVEGEVNRWVLNTVFLFLAVAGASLALFALGKLAFGAAA